MIDTMPTMTHRFPELVQLIKDRAITLGEFTLASGEKSNIYCDGKKLALTGKGSAAIADAISCILSDIKYDAIAGMEMGAIPMIAAAGLRLFDTQQRDLPMLVIRKESKSYGTQKRIEGPLPESPARVIMLEDVVTSGGSVIKAIDVIEAAGHEVILAISMLDRESGGIEALEKRGVPYTPLVRMSELELEER